MQTTGRAVDKERESICTYIITRTHICRGEGGWWHRILKTKDREKKKRKKKKSKPPGVH